MSSISSTTGRANLWSFLQSVNQSSPSSGASAASPTASAAATSTTKSAATSVNNATQPAQGHHRHGHGHADKGGLFAQLQQTVTSALQSTQQGGTNANQAIQDAIAKVFQNNNTAVSAIGTPGSSNTSTDPDAAKANTPASLTAAAGSTTPPANSSLQAFFQTLQSFGVNPQQFHQDFLAAAAQGAQNGTATPSAAFQSFRPGSLLDITG